MLSTTARAGLVALAAALGLCASPLQGQSILQQIPDRAAVETTNNGASRRGIVRGYAAWGEYSIEYDDGRREWVPAAQVRAVGAIAPAATIGDVEGGLRRERSKVLAEGTIAARQQRVVAVVTFEQVGPQPPDQPVVSNSAAEKIIPPAAFQRVVAFFAVNDVAG